MIGATAPAGGGHAPVLRVPSMQAQPKFAPAVAGRQAVDLLALAVADVADEHVPGRAVEREPPRVAEPVGPHARAERVAGRGRAGRRADAEDLAEQRVAVLGGRRRRAAVAGADVEHPVAAELELAAVVVARVAVRDPQQLAAARRVGAGRVRRAAVLEHAQRAGRAVGEEDVEAAGGVVVGRERDREQAALAGHLGEPADVEERAAARDPDEPGLLDDEQPRVVRRRGRVHRGGEPADLHEPWRRRRRRGRAQRAERDRDHDRAPDRALLRRGATPGAHDQWSATWPSSGSSGLPCSCQALIPPSSERAS